MGLENKPNVKIFNKMKIFLILKKCYFVYLILKRIKKGNYKNNNNNFILLFIIK